jgi:hypothetical protein
MNRKRRGIGEPRTIVIHKDKSEGLGISITVSSLGFTCFFMNSLNSAMPKCMTALNVGICILLAQKFGCKMQTFQHVN